MEGVAFILWPHLCSKHAPLLRPDALFNSAAPRAGILAICADVFLHGKMLAGTQPLYPCILMEKRPQRICILFNHRTEKPLCIKHLFHPVKKTEAPASAP